MASQTETIIQIALAVIQTLTLVALIVYVKDTRTIARTSLKSVEIASNTLSEMKVAREEEVAPYIIVYFDIPLGEHLIYLVFKNIGKSVAANVKFRFDPPLQSSFTEFPDNLPILQDGIGSMPPNYEFRTLLDSTIEYFNSGAPLIYKVFITYHTISDSNQNNTTEQLLDLSAFKGRKWVHKKGLDDLVKQVEKAVSNSVKMSKALDQISSNLASGIWLKNAEVLSNELQLEPNKWKLNAIAKLNEYKMIWEVVYKGKIDQLYGPFLTDLRNRTTILSVQLFVIAASTPSTFPSQIKEDLAHIAAKLSELAKLRFYIDGGRSTEKFDGIGTTIVEEINKLIEQIQKDEKVSNILLP